MQCRDQIKKFNPWNDKDNGTELYLDTDKDYRFWFYLDYNNISSYRSEISAR